MKNIGKSSNNPLSFDNGIAGVSFPKTTDPVANITTGKGGSISSPASNTIGNISQEKLYASSLEMKMTQFLSPTITIQSILQPVLYNSALRGVRKKIVKAIEEQEKKDVAVMALVALLKEDEELKSLLQMYRGLLHKG